MRRVTGVHFKMAACPQPALQCRTACDGPATLPRRRGQATRRLNETMTKSRDGFPHTHVRVSGAQWERIERAAQHRHPTDALIAR